MKIITTQTIKDYLASKKVQKRDFPTFRSGDTVRVAMSITEGDKVRVQEFEGVVIKKRGGSDPTFTVRKISFGVGVERIFSLGSPHLQSVEVIKQGSVRRSKLYYMRKRSGKAARVNEKAEVVAQDMAEPEKQEATPHAQAIS